MVLRCKIVLELSKMMSHFRMAYLCVISRGCECIGCGECQPEEEEKYEDDEEEEE